MFILSDSDINLQLKLIELLISEINRIHKEFSEEYFKNNEKIKLNKTHKDNFPINQVLKYRLNLHESIIDYLMLMDKRSYHFEYRVKTNESIIYKVNKNLTGSEHYPINRWLNDIFGCRIVVEKDLLNKILNSLDLWKAKHNLMSYYTRDKDGYKGTHIYFKNKDNGYYPWELQVWDRDDLVNNILSHKKYKREFLME